jgi:hypothetical protein
MMLLQRGSAATLDETTVSGAGSASLRGSDGLAVGVAEPLEFCRLTAIEGSQLGAQSGITYQIGGSASRSIV